MSATGGGDFYQDSQKQRSRAVVAAAALGFARADLVLAGIRYQHDRIGPGTGIVVGGGLPLLVSRLRGQVTRFVGDDGYRAWRFKLGPEGGILGAHLGVFYTRDQSPGTPSLNGAATEASLPLLPGVTARAGAGYGVTSDHVYAALATLGAGWSPVHSIEISAEVGRTRGAASTTALAPSGPTAVRPLQRLPLLGGGGGEGSNGSAPPPAPTLTTGLLSVRVSFP